MSFPLRSFPSYTVPPANDVRDGTTYDSRTGTLDLPAEADVRLGTVFDGGTKTGTLDPGAGGGGDVGWPSGPGWK